MNSQNIRDADRQKLIELAAEIEPAKNESIAKEALGLAHYYLEKSENQAKYIKQLERVNAEQRQRLYEAKYGWSAGEDAEQRWIPVTERLPEEDVEVLITYRYKEGEGDRSHSDIDITTYGQMYFGGNKVGNHKHWRAPFEYFESNYEVVAWMPLPSPYKGEEVINEKT